MMMTGQTTAMLTLTDRIGAGATAEVFGAHAPDLGTDVAVKLMRAEHAVKPLSRQRFAIECDLACRLSHPNLVEGLDTGLIDCRPYLAMRRIQGVSASTLLRRGPIKEHRVVRIVSDLTEALSHLHEATDVLAHRDVKPENVLVCDDGSTVLCDLGIVLTRASKGWTSDRALVGSPYYLSPEQWEAPDDIDARADVYALGAVLFELLTGTKLFPGSTPAEIRSRHRDPYWAPRRLHGEVDPHWRAIIEHAVAYRADARYPSMRAFRDAITASPAREKRLSARLPWTRVRSLVGQE